MRKIAERETNCKRISKWCFSNFIASPLTEKKVSMDILRINYIFFFSLYNLVHFYPLKGDNFFSSVVQICNRNYSAILATLQITSYALGV